MCVLVRFHSSGCEVTTKNHAFLMLTLTQSNCYSVGATAHDEPWPLFYSFLNMQTVDRTPWARDQPVATPLPTKDNADIHASSGIRTHDPNV
jgi:hypothetical protein